MNLTVFATDSLTVEKPKQGWFSRLIDSFSEVDTNYVEPQHYNWALMLQSINTYDYYKLSAGEGRNRQTISFAPDLGIRIGPYFGWRWIFLGYTIDMRTMNIFSGKRKLEIDGSIYSSRFGADIFYRRSVQNYNIKSVDFGSSYETKSLEGVAFDGLNVSITGVNLYYIFNHKRFSYPAAFSQSTIQKISCGSWLAGIGYTRHSLDFDHNSLQTLIDEKMGSQTVRLDSGFMFNEVRYYDVSLSGGYAYNWVFAKNWLLGSSLQMALGYKRSYGTMADNGGNGFSFKNFNLDGIGRFALVYNNMRWYAGASAIFHTYNYRNARFRTTNTFGSLNVYVGVNFGLKKKYRQEESE